MADLPRPKVTVTPDFSVSDGKQRVDLVVERDSKAKSYKGVGNSQCEAMADATDKLLSDPHSAEWLPRWRG